MTMSPDPSILLIGIDYFASRCSSDKNFWHQLLPILAKKSRQIVVLSFNYRGTRAESQPAPRHNIQIINLRPSHVGIDFRPDPSAVHNPEKCHSHFKSPPLSPVEYLLSFIRIRPLIRSLITEKGITNIHCMDNFGPVMHLLQRWAAPVPVSVSAMGYYARGPLHDAYLRLCYRGLDAVIPFSEAYRRKLIELGLLAENAFAIPWGVDTDSLHKPASAGERAALKRALGIEADRRLVLWTGFIQQIKEQELYASIEAAQHIAQRRPDAHFVFALKPECYHPQYQRFSAPWIRVLTTTSESFPPLARAADYLLSPIVNTRSIVTPPLTWLEMMAMGVPIITNRVPGVEAVIQSGENGFVAENIGALPVLLGRALSSPDPDALRANARKHILTHFSISQSATGYHKVWSSLRNGGQ
jgi:glycosyltransferase involved in cell wall biosynthesis